MAQHPCPRCGTLIPVGVSYCDRCRPEAEAQRKAWQAEARKAKERKATERQRARRDPERLAFYRSKAWKAQSRARMIEQQYQCEAKLEGCTRLAVDVHHRIPLSKPEGWARRLDWDNLECVCANCHNKRHPDKFKRTSEEFVIDLRNLDR